MNVITAFTKLDTPVESHAEVRNAVSDPVKIIAINSDGAWPVTPLPEGEVVVYDLREYDEVERVEFEPSDFEYIGDEGIWVRAYERVVHYDQVPRTETFATVVAESEDSSKPEEELEAEIVGD